IDATIPYTHVASARIRHARPTVAILRPSLGLLALLLLVRELRRALGHERVAFADEPVAPLAHLHDDLATVAERVRDGADVAHGDRLGAVAVANAEGLAAGDVADRAVDHPSGQLIDAAAVRAGREATRRDGLASGREGRVDERAGQEQGRRERDDEADSAFAGRVHRSAPQYGARPGEWCHRNPQRPMPESAAGGQSTRGRVK